jgi:hypothetical protein
MATLRVIITRFKLGKRKGEKEKMANTSSWPLSDQVKVVDEKGLL